MTTSWKTLASVAARTVRETIRGTSAHGRGGCGRVSIDGENREGGTEQRRKIGGRRKKELELLDR